METIKQALLALTSNVFNFVSAPSTVPPYIIYQQEGDNDLCTGNRHAETEEVVNVEL